MKDKQNISKEDLFGLNIYPHWHCSFPISDLNLEQGSINFTELDPRIKQLLQKMDIKDKRILELGALEGIHTVMLESAGAHRILAIEGRRDNFFKCLLVKNAFKLQKSTFLYADAEEVIDTIPQRFDLCLALGILYHLNNPIRLLKSVGQKAGSIFLWSHVALDDYPEGPICEIEEREHCFKGKYVQEDTKEYLSGLKTHSFWLFEESLIQAVKQAGFENIEIIERQKHEHGPALTLFGKK